MEFWYVSIDICIEANLWVSPATYKYFHDLTIFFKYVPCTHQGTCLGSPVFHNQTISHVQPCRWGRITLGLLGRHLWIYSENVH